MNIEPTKVPMKGGGFAVVRKAAQGDAETLRRIYDAVYEGRYTLTIICDPEESRVALDREDIHWLVAEVEDRVVGSVVFSVDEGLKLAKVFGAVVLPEFRGSGLTEAAMRLGIAELVDGRGLAHSVYGTARTVSPAPRKLLKNLGFKDIGIFPNVRKVDNYETHCMSAYFRKGALESRVVPPRLPSCMKPFFSIVRRATGIGDAEWHDTRLEPSSPYAGGWIDFELVCAPEFIRRRWKALKAERKLKMQFFPFHEPNLLLAAKDGSAEVYIHYCAADHHAAIIGGHESVPDLTHLLNSVVMALDAHGARFLELLTSAYHPEVIKKILDARFIPSAYYPGLRWSQGRGHDYIVFTKSFVALDFRSIAAEGVFRDYLREYFSLWKTMYIEGA
ncbi:MAG: GNAT family N-acetyltransferase [Elusimicrobia bacterium]|nr:GNAT family N-acetyltransferase [Elusimicrobiota bacterium]